MRKLLVFSLALGFLVSLSTRVPAEQEQQENKTEEIKTAIQDLGSDDVMVRREAAVTLTRSGPEAKEAIPELLKTLQDEDPIVRQNSVDAIGEINSPSAMIVDALIPLLHDEEYLVRLKAAETLGKFRQLSLKAEKPLLDLLKDPVPIVRGFAVEAVTKVLPFNKSTPVLIPLLKDPDWNVRRKATVALDTIGTPQALKALEQNRNQGRKK